MLSSKEKDYISYRSWTDNNRDITLIPTTDKHSSLTASSWLLQAPRSLQGHTGYSARARRQVEGRKVAQVGNNYYLQVISYITLATNLIWSCGNWLERARDYPDHVKESQPSLTPRPLSGDRAEARDTHGTLSGGHVHIEPLHARSVWTWHLEKLKKIVDWYILSLQESQKIEIGGGNWEGRKREVVEVWQREGQDGRRFVEYMNHPTRIGALLIQVLSLRCFWPVLSIYSRSRSGLRNEYSRSAVSRNTS